MDSDGAQGPKSRMPSAGAVILSDGCRVHAHSRGQAVVALSSCGAELTSKQRWGFYTWASSISSCRWTARQFPAGEGLGSRSIWIYKLYVSKKQFYEVLRRCDRRRLGDPLRLAQVNEMMGLGRLTKEEYGKYMDEGGRN